MESLPIKRPAALGVLTFIILLGLAFALQQDIFGALLKFILPPLVVGGAGVLTLNLVDDNWEGKKLFHERAGLIAAAVTLVASGPFSWRMQFTLYDTVVVMLTFALVGYSIVGYLMGAPKVDAAPPPDRPEFRKDHVPVRTRVSATQEQRAA